MSVKIKLTRLGSKKHPFYRVVAANDATARDGRPLEFLGYYNPMTNPAQVSLDAENIKKWLDRGAQPTDTVRALLKANLTAPAAE
ncbi:MAG: 30S ribosomal protein S16 [Desulfovibrionaceae bacterium]|nr:30S ribosomal protein S16 [Desulfovibrionaceae bacterium]